MLIFFFQKRRTLRNRLLKQREGLGNRANSINKQPASVALPPASSTTNAVSSRPPQTISNTTAHPVNTVNTASDPGIGTGTGIAISNDKKNHSNSNSTAAAGHLGSPKVVPPYRRLSLLEATANSDCLPPPPPGDFRQPGYVPARSGRTVTWHNPSHTRSHSPDNLV